MWAEGTGCQVEGPHSSPWRSYPRSPASDSNKTGNLEELCAHVQDRKRETGELHLLGCWATLQVHCSHLLGGALPGLQLQVARQVPQLHDQVAEEHPHTLHLSEEKAHPVVQVGVGGLQGRGGAWAPRGRAGRWRQRPGRLLSRHSGSHGFRRSGVQDRWCTGARGTWVWGREHTYSDPGSLALAATPPPAVFPAL